MSRSYKKQPYTGTGWYGGGSEKEDKRVWHRKMRTHCLLRIRYALQYHDPDVLLPLRNEVSNLWCMTKDGKWRFDPREHPELMRK